MLYKTQNRVVVEYALRDMVKPIGVAEWQTRLVRSLPEELRGSLPTVAQLEEEPRKVKDRRRLSARLVLRRLAFGPHVERLAVDKAVVIGGREDGLSRTDRKRVDVNGLAALVRLPVGTAIQGQQEQGERDGGQ
jgi:hypothetical protein